jgi:Xaa-Pro aminopeptidase
MLQKEGHRGRRDELARRIDTGVAIISTAPEKARSRDTNFPHCPDKTFYYFTGCTEPEAVLVLLAKNGKCEKSILFCRKKDTTQEMWTGKRYGPEKAKEVFGVDEAYSVGEFEKIALEYLNNRTYGPAFVSFAENYEWGAVWLTQKFSSFKSFPDMRSIHVLTDEMRLIKTSEEIDVMRRAAQISANAHRHAMRMCLPGMMEYEIEAEMTRDFRSIGCDKMSSYEPIVAGGENACTLHYVANKSLLISGDLLLIDYACELYGYASDVTRTFPVSGKFSTEQKALYEVVLDAQKFAIAEVQTGNTFDGPNKKAREIMTEGLVKLGVLTGDVEKLIEENACNKFFPHRTSHWLGLDVHDVGSYKNYEGNSRVLEPGMVLTVEPGIYIPKGMEGVDPKYHGIGIRIEDDILVTETGNEVFSRCAPKEIEEIEALMHPESPVLYA